MRSLRLLGICLLAAIGVFGALAGSAQARDRNHDRISDRWEKNHKLSLKVNQARKDQDHDGLKNRGEFRAQTDPRDDDSDNDGVEDGDEKAGTVGAYNPTTGELTVNLFGGGSITALVTPDTQVECDTQGDDESSDDDERGGKSSLRHEGEGDDERNGDSNDGEHGDDESDHASCAPDALKVGAVVQEAEIKLGNGKAVFKDIELVA
jgi:hypothetical protein